MNVHLNNKRAANPRRAAFTLIEMIGVLAVIAILAAVLIPKVFQAINDSRVTNAALSYNTVKTAISDHYAKFGSLLSSNGIAMTAGAGAALAFDRVLVSEGFLDKPFDVKISAITAGVSNHVEIIAALAPTVDPNVNNNAYNLDNTGTTATDMNKALGGVVVQAVIPGVTENDAKDLNDRLDGPALGSAIGADDLLGRVKYDGGANPTTVYVYLTHR